MPGDLFTFFHLLFFFAGGKQYWKSCCVSFLHPATIGELRVCKCRDIVCLFSLVASAPSCFVLLYLPQLPYSGLHSSICLVLQPPVFYKTSLSLLICIVLWMVSPVGQGKIYFFGMNLCSKIIQSLDQDVNPF